MKYIKKLEVAFLFSFLFISSVIYVRAESRIIENFNSGWKFHAGDIENGASPSLNDHLWRDINLPHDFQIEQPWVQPGSSESGSKDATANTSSTLSHVGLK